MVILIVAGAATSSGRVGPVVVVVDRAGLVEADGDASRRCVERTLSGLTLPPDEPRRQVDVDNMILARDGILERVAASLPHALHLEGALAAGAFDRDLRLHEA